MAIPFSIVDAGEAAAVALLRSPESDQWMAGLAAFLRLPVTVFAWPAPGGYRVRTFGPAGELELSGTGLVAFAHALWNAELRASSEPVAALTASGTFEAVRGPGGRIEVRQGGGVLFAAPRAATIARGELAWPP